MSHARCWSLPCPPPFIWKCEKACTPFPILRIFHRTLFTTKWFLMSRTNSCILFHVNHPECTYNFLIIYCSYINIDQEELVYSTPWHVHSNPETHWSYHWIISMLTFLLIISLFTWKTKHITLYFLRTY